MYSLIIKFNLFADQSIYNSVTILRKLSKIYISRHKIAKMGQLFINVICFAFTFMHLLNLHDFKLAVWELIKLIKDAATTYNFLCINIH